MPAPHDRRLGFVIADINRLVRREFDRRVRDLGFTRAQWLFLYYLTRQPGCTQSDLAELLQMEKISVSRQAVRLEKAGWIHRNNHAADGRAYHLELTPKAERIVMRLDERAERLREDYMAGIPGNRRAALLNDLGRIKANLQRLGAPLS